MTGTYGFHTWAVYSRGGLFHDRYRDYETARRIATEIGGFVERGY